MLQPPVLSVRQGHSLPRRIVLDVVRRTVRHRGRWARLSRPEFDLMLVFSGQPGRVVGDDELYSALWPDPDDEPEFAVNSLGARISRLRRKLTGVGLTIRTMHGHGRWLEERTDP